MSWLFSQALVEEYLGGGRSDGEPSAPSNGNLTQQAYCAHDKMTVFSRLSRFGMTYKPLTADRGEELLTLYRAGFPARTYQSQGKVQELTEPDQECGPTWRASLAKFDHDSSSWKTVQLSLLGDSELSSVTWPRSGMTAGGQCWELQMSGHRTSATDSGLSGVPTPNAQEGSGGGTLISKIKPGRQVHLRDWVKTWPTPIASDSRGSSGQQRPGKQVQLVDAVKFATPLSRDWRSGKASQATLNKNSRPLSEQIGGSLNPTWVEWLMGWPLGWTDLKPLAMDKSHCVQQQPGES